MSRYYGRLDNKNRIWKSPQIILPVLVAAASSALQTYSNPEAGQDGHPGDVPPPIRVGYSAGAGHFAGAGHSAAALHSAAAGHSASAGHTSGAGHANSAGFAAACKKVKCCT